MELKFDLRNYTLDEKAHICTKTKKKNYLFGID